MSNIEILFGEFTPIEWLSSESLFRSYPGYVGILLLVSAAVVSCVVGRRTGSLIEGAEVLSPTTFCKLRLRTLEAARKEAGFLLIGEAVIFVITDSDWLRVRVKVLGNIVEAVPSSLLVG